MESTNETRSQQVVRILFAVGVMSAGVLTLVLGYGALLFGPVSGNWIPWLKPVGYASGLFMMGAGAALLFSRAARAAAYVLLPFLLVWTLTRVPIVVSDPGREISWFAVGEIGVLAAAATMLFARLAELEAGSMLERAIRAYGIPAGRILFALSLLTFGLAHFFEFAARTVSLVPQWLPYRTAWADLTGAAQIAAGLGVLLSIYPRLAAAMEAAMLSVFTVLVWIPALVANPRRPSNWGEFVFTFALAAAAWVVAESISGRAPSPLNM